VGAVRAPERRSPARAALVASLALLALAVALILSGSPVSVAGTNVPRGAESEPIATTQTGASYCQRGERLPREVSAIRVWLAAITGPSVSVAVWGGGRQLTGGRSAPGWSDGSVTVPVRALAHAASDVTLCVSFRLRDETVYVQGGGASAAHGLREGARRLPARMWVEYLRPSASSWVSLIPAIVRRMGYGHALPGRWTAFAALALLAAAAALASRGARKELR
jgi:hypothetical protein